MASDRRDRARPRIRGAEIAYSKSLRSVAMQVGALVSAYDPGEYHTAHELADLLLRYAQALRPWATRVANNMLLDVNRRDQGLWDKLTGEIGAQLRHDVRRTQLGVVMRTLLHEQVDLITTLPKKAAERVHRLTLQGLEGSRRASEIAKDIKLSASVSEFEALRIARTEVGRTSTTLSQARAGQIGSTHYIWRTAEDGDVRKGHKEMDGKICEWAKPPAVNENGRIMYHHPGCIWNCRCWPETIIPDLRN